MRRMLVALSVLTLCACSDLERVERRNPDGIIVERYSRGKTDSLWEGSYEAFDDSGVLVESATYTDGKLNGTRRLYHPNGEVQYEETHRDGKYDGAYRAYFPDGTLELEGRYVADEAVDVWTTYYPNGQKKEEVTFSDNAENGPFTEWYSNGVLKAQGTYIDGDNEQGELVLYDLAGEIQKRMHCEAGTCRTVWRAQTVADEQQ